MNDFSTHDSPPAEPPAATSITEFCGHMFPTKRFDNDERVQAARAPPRPRPRPCSAATRFAGGIGWCAFDYNTHADFGSGDRICYHGVIGHLPHPQAGRRLLQVAMRSGRGDRARAGFHWAIGDQAASAGRG